MSASSGVGEIKKRIHDLRADADINEVESRHLRTQADALEAHVATDRRVADELEALLPEGQRPEAAE